MMPSDVLLAEQAIILFLVLNCIANVKPMTQRPGYGAVDTTTKVCPLGYIGLNCLIGCRYPAFGHFCQNKCNCLQQHCDHRTGCKDGSPTINMPDQKMNTVNTVNTMNTPIQQRRTPKGCPIGFIGENCKLQCRFPSFGFQCQQNCSCKENHCDYKEGCKYNMMTNKMVTTTASTSTYSQDELEVTRTQVQYVEHTFSSQEDIMMKSNDESKPDLLSTILIVLSIFAFILTCVYVSTFVMRPWQQEIENNVVLEIHRNSDIV